MNTKWITPSESQCEAEGGKTKDAICAADWNSAKKICRSVGGRLPTLKEIGKEIINCGGVFSQTATYYDDQDILRVREQNSANNSYQQCYKNSGFSGKRYWSSEPDTKHDHHAWNVDLFNGYQDWLNDYDPYYVRCINLFSSSISTASQQPIKTVDKLYYIQIGAFKHVPSPRFMKKVKNARFTFVTKITRGVYRVRVGPYNSYNEAKAVLPVVKQKIGVDGLIVKF